MSRTLAAALYGALIALGLAACAPKPTDQVDGLAERWKDSTRQLMIETARALDVVECGGRGQRWSVRVGADEAAWKIDVSNVQDATLSDLEALEYKVQQDYPAEPRARSGPEFDVYRVKGYLLRIQDMDDGDLHLTISDAANPQERRARGLAVHTLTAEAPDALCVGGKHDQVLGPSRFASELAEVRKTLVSGLPDADGATFLPGIPVEIVGIAMMDQEKATGMTELELHPLLSVRIGP